MIDLIFATIIRYGSSFISLLTSLFVARELGAENFGKFSLIIFVCTAFASVLSFSIQRSVLLFVSRDVNSNTREIFSAYFFIIMISVVLSLLISLFFVDITLAFIIAIVVAGIQWQLFSSSLVVVNEGYSIRKNQMFFFIGRGGCLISVYIISWITDDYSNYLLMMALSLILPLLLEVFFVYRKYLINFELKPNYIITKIKKSKWMHLDTIFSQLIIYSSSFVLSQTQLTEDLGVYNLSQQIVISSLIVVSVFQIYISRIVKDNVNSNNLKVIVIRFFQFSVAYALLLICVSSFFYFNYQIIGPEFKSLYLYISVMSLAGVFSLGNKVMLPIFVRLDQTKFVSVITVISGMISLISSIWLISLFGQYGAVASFCLGYSISFVFFLYKFLGVLKYER